MFNEAGHNQNLLLERLKSGDAQAFTEIYNLYHAGIYMYVLDFVKIPAMAEDITHEVFTKIWEVRAHLSINTSFKGYLYRISHNKSIDALKKIAREEKLSAEVLLHFPPQLADDGIGEAVEKKYEQLYMDAVAALPPQRRNIFILCREQGKTYDQASAELGISRNAVKQHMVLAMRFLRRYLAEKGSITLPAAIIKILFQYFSFSIYPVLYFLSLIS